MRNLRQYRNKAFQASTDNFQRLRGTAFLDDDCSVSPELIPLSRWCKENNYTPKEARTLIRKRYLYAIKFKGKIWVATKEIPLCF